MKTIYNTLLKLLGEIPELRWIDLDKGQLDYTRPAVAFPCALISIQYSNCQDMSLKIQQCTILATVRLGFDFTGETSAKTPEPNRETALAYYDLANKVYSKIQGYTDKEVRPFSRKRMTEEVRGGGIKVLTIPFETIYTDQTAAV